MREIGFSFANQAQAIMNFWQRLSRFGIGIFLGTALSLYFFGGRGCGSWLPSAQVRKTIVEGGIQFSPELRASQPDLTVTDVLTYVGSADVDFGASGTREQPQWYVLSGAVEGSPLTGIEVVLMDTASVVRHVDLAR